MGALQSHVIMHIPSLRLGVSDLCVLFSVFYCVNCIACR